MKTAKDALQIKNMDDKDYTLPKVKKLPEQLPKPPFRMCVSGSSGSGKTNFITNLFRKEFYGNFWAPNHIFVFSPTATLDPKLKDNIPTENLYEDFNAQVFEEIYDKQKGILKQYGKRRLDHVLIILDDLLGHKVLNNKGLIDKYIFKTRHYNVSLIFSVQKYNGLPRTVRLNSDFMAIFFSGYNEIDNIVEQNFDKKNRPVFRDALIKIFSEPYAFLVINYQVKNPAKRYYKNLTEPLEIAIT